MPGLHVHRSNRLESLVDRIADLVRTPLPNPLQPETIVVQSLGMRRWLGLSLAGRLGIAMNCAFPFPDTLAQNVFRAAFPDLPKDPLFSRDILPWRLFFLLRRIEKEPVFAPLRNYVGEGELAELKRFQLARQLAILFDRHLAYRPEELLEWERRGNSEWQAQLWRELARGEEKAHPPALLERFHKRVVAGETNLPGTPPRISVFGISALPPFHIHLFGSLARCVDLHLFLFEPTDQYWGDIQSPREQRRFLRQHAQPSQTAADFHLETGNALLASLGKPSRLFAEAVQELEPADSEELFVPPSETFEAETPTLLQRVQADIFELRERSPEERSSIPEGDRSIQVHCCHGPMREVEVLHDQLLDLFERLPGLTPKDIVVIMPDVEKFAPFIEAVFGAPEDHAHLIPFTIADLSAQSESSAAQAFLDLLALQGSRFGVASVLQLLETEPIRRRFELDEDELETIRNWIEAMHIRWGIDSAHRQEFDLPAFAQNSWRTGLDRLLLGYALRPDGHELFEGLTPADGIEGGQTATLGKFAEFTDKLFEHVLSLVKPRSLQSWAQTLHRLLSAFLADSDESANEIQRLRSILDELADLPFAREDTVPFDVVRAHLTQALAETDSGRGFLVGHVTFCSMKPMRSIPFRVICMLGLNDDAFPRRDPAGTLDLLAKQGSVGRSRRDEDRQVFLESLLSAREALLLSYSGLSPKDNSESPPSVVVSEVLDYLDANYVSGADPLRSLVLTKHRLQPFSDVYFRGDPRLFSFSQENCRATLALAGERANVPARIPGPLPDPGPEWRRLDLRRLQRFFRSPARFFLQERLQVNLPDPAILLDETEPMSLDSLSRWELQKDLSSTLLLGGEREPLLRAIRASGTLPAGYAGEELLQSLQANVEPLIARVRGFASEPALPSLPFALAIDDWELSGALHDRRAAGLVKVVGWDVSAKDRLSAWIEHLVANAVPEAAGRETRLFATDATVSFSPVADAVKLLRDLLAIFGEGLLRPIPFFVKSSFDFAHRTLRPSAQAKLTPIESARKKWMTEAENDRYIGLCFEADPLHEVFEKLSVQIFGPMLEHAREVKA